MSMSEFERRVRDAEQESSFLSSNHASLPEDFSAEDIAFAQELETHFPLAFDKEELPPFFTQTLLESEEPRYQALADGFEKITCTRVFRQLELNRRLFRPSRPSVRGLVNVFPSLPRPVVAFVLACCLFMLSTMLATGPLYASGLYYLMSGTHSGVLLVNGYPKLSPTPVRSNQNTNAETGTGGPEQLYLQNARRLLKFPIYWPEYLPDGYQADSNIYFYRENEGWADGPIVTLNFYDQSAGHAPRQISICEFKPLGKVLIVSGSKSVTVNPNGLSPSISVEGQWVSDSSAAPTWNSEGRTEIISENKDGVVFWIAADKLDSTDINVLQHVLISLSLLDISHNIYMMSSLSRDGDANPWLFSNTVLYLDDPGNSTGPSFILIGTPSPSATLGYLRLAQKYGRFP